MLKVFKELDVRGEAAKLDTLFQDIFANLPAGWSRDEAREKYVNKLGGTSDNPQFAFQWIGSNNAPASILFLVHETSGAQVTRVWTHNLIQ